MYCKYCGSPIDNDSRFCSHCGRQLSENDIVAEKAVWTDFSNNQQNQEQQENLYQPRIEDIKPELLVFRVIKNYNYFFPIDEVTVEYQVKNCSTLRCHIDNGKTIQTWNISFSSNTFSTFTIDLKDVDCIAQALRIQLELENEDYVYKSDIQNIPIATNFNLQKHKEKYLKYKQYLIRTEERERIIDGVYGFLNPMAVLGLIGFCACTILENFNVNNPSINIIGWISAIICLAWLLGFISQLLIDALDNEGKFKEIISLHDNNTI